MERPAATSEKPGRLDRWSQKTSDRKPPGPSQSLREAGRKTATEPFNPSYRTRPETASRLQIPSLTEIQSLNWHSQGNVGKGDDDILKVNGLVDGVS